MVEDMINSINHMKNFVSDFERKIIVLNKSLNDVNEEKKRINEVLEMMSSKLDNLLNTYSNIENAVNRITDIRGLIEHINTESERVRRIKEDLIKMNEKLNSTISVAKKYIDEIEKTTGVKVPEPQITNDQINSVIRMYRQGWSTDRISKTLNISQDFVTLIIEKYSRGNE